MTADAWVELVGIAAAALAGIASLLVIALHLVGTDVDPRQDGVSAYALTRFAALYRAQVLATGAAGLLLASALLIRGVEAMADAVLVLFAVSRILIARYPTDPRGTTTLSRDGRRHVLLAATTFLTIAVAAPWISLTLTGMEDWRGPTTAIVGLGCTTAVLALGTFPTLSLPATQGFFGLVERGAYAGWLLWIAMTGLAVGGWI